MFISLQQYLDRSLFKESFAAPKKIRSCRGATRCVDAVHPRKLSLYQIERATLHPSFRLHALSRGHATSTSQFSCFAR